MLNLKSIAQLFEGGITFVNITDELTRFRQRLETEADQPVDQIEVNAAMLLSDLAGFLELGQKQHDQIIGAEAVQHLILFLDSRVTTVH